MNSSELIVRCAAAQVRALDLQRREGSEGHEPGHAQKDDQRYGEMANLVIGLPDRIREAMAEGAEFPAKELEELNRLAMVAGASLLDGNPGCLSALIVGRRLGDPNIFERMAEDLFPDGESHDVF